LRHYIAHIIGMDESRVRVIQPNVGGAFGSKIPTYQEEPLIAYLARKLGRPVKWIEERTENLLTGGHAREQKVHFEAAYKRDGQVTGLKAWSRLFASPPFTRFPTAASSCTPWRPTSARGTPTAASARRPLPS
jgi:CO/xanthine dehydrogenase Mo-binding subunit